MNDEHCSQLIEFFFVSCSDGDLDKKVQGSEFPSRATISISGRDLEKIT